MADGITVAAFRQNGLTMIKPVRMTDAISAPAATHAPQIQASQAEHGNDNGIQVLQHILQAGQRAFKQPPCAMNIAGRWA